MIKIIAIASATTVMVAIAMDDPSIDMLVLKKAGIEALHKAIREHKAPVAVSRSGRAHTVHSPCFAINHKIIESAQDDQFAATVKRKIAAIESKKGYHPEKWQVDKDASATTYMPTNHLDTNTRYWRKVDEHGAPYIQCESVFYEPELPKKALEELGAPYREPHRECGVM